jgi:urease accessory protein
MDWLILQLADSAFPTGGFAHSGGLEAAWQAGEVRGGDSLQNFVSEIIWQTGYGSLPLVNAGHDEPEKLAELDGLCDSFLSNHVANRASRVQGRAFISTCERCFPLPDVVALRECVKVEKMNLHFAPLFGASMRALSVSKERAQELCLFLAMRGVISAAVRLNIVGPHQGQQIEFTSFARVNDVLARCGNLGADDLAQTAPLPDLFQSTHDRLYSRLFQS